MFQFGPISSATDFGLYFFTLSNCYCLSIFWMQNVSVCLVSRDHFEKQNRESLISFFLSSLLSSLLSTLPHTHNTKPPPSTSKTLLILFLDYFGMEGSYPSWVDKCLEITIILVTAQQDHFLLKIFGWIDHSGHMALQLFHDAITLHQGSKNR